MKNTELIKLKNLLSYKGEFDKVQPLLKNSYNAKEASKLFGCTMAQVKGYLNNYKQYFEGHVKVIGTPGKQETRISQEGMFLLAILLDKKSTLAKEIADRVRELIANPKPKKEESTMDTTQLEMAIDTKVSKTEKEEPKTTKVEKDKALAETPKEESVKINKVIIKNGEIVKEEEEIEISKKDIERMNKLEKIIDKFINKETSKEEVSKEQAICEMLKTVAKAIKENNKTEINFTEEDIAKANYELLELALELKSTNMIYENHIAKCKVLGFEEMEAAILVHEAFVFDKDPDSQILDALYRKSQKELARKRGVLKESIEFLAYEKFNGQVQDAYHYLTNELRYYMGINMRKMRDKHKNMNINPISYLDMIIGENGFDYAMDIIATLLAE